MLSGASLLICIIFIVVALRFKVAAWLTILLAAIFLALITVSWQEWPNVVLSAIFSSVTFKLVAATMGALVFARLLERSGTIALLAESLALFSRKVSFVTTPLLLGLAPMPTNAMLAYSTNRQSAKDFTFNRQQSAFINYWLSRVFEFSLPMYPSIIMTALIFEISYLKLFLILLPLTIVAIAIGFIYTIILFNRSKSTENFETKKREHNYRLAFRGIVLSLWPVALLVGLVFIGLELWVAFILVFVVLALVKRTSRRNWLDCIKQAFKPKIIGLLLAAMFLVQVIVEGGAAQNSFEILSSWGVPAVVMLVLIPLVVHFAVGGSAAMIAVVFPMLMVFLRDTDGTLLIGHIMLAFAAARVGSIASPANVAFVMVSQFAQIKMRSMYPHIGRAALILLGSSALFYMFF